MTAFYFKRVELVEICLTEKTKRDTDYRRANFHLKIKQNGLKFFFGNGKEKERRKEGPKGKRKGVILFLQFQESVDL
jgi:hypothetical protein